MAKTIINFGDANIDVDLFAAYQKKAFEELRAQDEAKETAKESAKDFKETCESCELTTKLPKKEVAAFFLARYEESKPKDKDDGKVVGTKVVIDRGELYTVLNSALDA